MTVRTTRAVDGVLMLVFLFVLVSLDPDWLVVLLSWCFLIKFARVFASITRKGS